MLSLFRPYRRVRRYSEFISSVIVLACQNSSNTPPTDPTFGMLHYASHSVGLNGI